MSAFWSGDRSRKIISRIVVEGDLVLQTPAHFGNGDTDELTDMPLLVDPFDGRTPLLTGTSIAGALRSYLRERQHGYGQSANYTSVSVLLFGGLKEDDEGEQSPLIVEDALGKNFGIEMRDGVHIQPNSRTAEEDKLFNLKLWQAGTTFPLRFELVIQEGADAYALKQALATVLEGFNSGNITLGARKSRGYGRASVTSWRVKIYDLTIPADLLDWLTNGNEPLDRVVPEPDIKKALGVGMLIKNQQQAFLLSAVFALDGSLLIRSGSGQDDQGPDMVHLHARQATGEMKPVLSGTSLGGVMRSRALKIAKTLGDQDRAQKLIVEMFGPKMQAGVQPKASRLIVHESTIQNARTDLIQNRVSIDRFTGGAREAMLFSEQPAFGDDGTAVTTDLRLINPKEHEIGLLLLLLKDLWTGDLPLGGESSVGRGRLKGKKALLKYQNGDSYQTWEIIMDTQDLTLTGDRNKLEAYVSALKTELKGKKP